MERSDATFGLRVAAADRLERQMVANLPVFGWPAAEVIRAMCETEAVSILVPVDIEGHLTDRNPGGLYL